MNNVNNYCIAVKEKGDAIVKILYCNDQESAQPLYITKKIKIVLFGGNNQENLHQTAEIVEKDFYFMEFLGIFAR